MKQDKTLKVFTKEDFEALKSGYFRELGKKSVLARRKKYGTEGLSALMSRAGTKGAKKRWGYNTIKEIYFSKNPRTKYNTIHQKNLRQFGKVDYCMNKNCEKKSNKFQRALIHGKKHANNIKNYYQLCHKCHSNYDNKNILPII